MTSSEQTRHLISLLAGRWTLAVLAQLADGGRRYQNLDDALEGVSHKVLTETLRRAERDGLISRHEPPSRYRRAVPGAQGGHWPVSRTAWPHAGQMEIPPSIACCRRSR